MKTAIYRQETINIENYPRELFHQLYLAGKKETLFCSVCQKPVQLYLGMKRDPYFFHSNSSLNDCKGTEAPVQVTEVSIEQNGFIIPKSRSISDTQTRQPSFRKAKLLPIKASFSKNNPAKANISDSYVQRLFHSEIPLDYNQLQAVLESDRPLLVLSGAGSGKTRVLTTKTAYLINEKRVEPKTLMLVTFTAKAANEMKQRLQSYPDMNFTQINQLVTGTFHSIFYRILMHHQPDQWNFEKILNKDWQKERIIRDAGKELELNEKEFAFDLALQQIGFWKNSLLLPHEVKTESKWEEQVAFLYKKYEETKKKNELFDFDDMLVGCYQLFSENPSLLERYQQRFQYFLIDEFQDINKVQYELIKLLSRIHKNVIAVGDDDQSIYAFRGSDPDYLIHFERDFPNAKVIKLEENYRSSHEIVSTANEVISHNKKRRAKVMKAQFSLEKPPAIFFPLDEEEEATMIVTEIQEKIANGAKPSDFAILFRTNASARAIFERLVTSSLPFRITQDAESFYDRFIPRSVLAYLKLSMNEDDADALNTILPSLFLKQSVLRDLKAESILNDCSLIEALSLINTGFSFQDKKLKLFPSIIRSLKQLSPVMAIDRITKDIGFEDYLKKRGSEGNKLEKGSDDIKDLKVSAKSFGNLQEFLLHAEHMSAQNKEMKKISKNIDNAITLSTIHRAKGLEYDSVFVLGVVDGSIPHDFALEEFRNGNVDALEEERRLLYVAMTRAKHHLYLSILENRRGKIANRSRFLTNLLKKPK
ncbi:UvrD-helicase domain-containing protein [Pseudoneobacillus rhizosphaerae]|uniref:DNA 3'-5' helicase n=1 Tax=Pseudoneobacillus rhizosphaerae TaxID=2880968 RepID=A0A9C7GDZ0_9BACI|nr:ATP-dependent helicase [Pseudoneobacillus rhizosphaerae]CAG9610669.1 Putative ATP-dependent DNA helicase YjcD [Pseudoneobacillus rhizosphaerae]